MKKIIVTLSLALAIVFAGSAYAQTLDKKSNDTKKPQKEVKMQNTQQQPEHKMMTPEEKAKKSVDKIAERVKDLTPEQVKKLTALHVTSYEQLDKDREANKADKEKMQAAMKASFEKMNDGIKNILTPEQFKVYKEARQQKKAEGDMKKKDEMKNPPKESKPQKEGVKK